jgi:hypothetical protein
VLELALVEVAAEPEVAVGRREQVVAQPLGEGLHLGRRLGRSGFDSITQGGVLEIGGHRRRRRAQIGHAGHRLDRLLDVERTDRATATGRQVGARGVQHDGDALHSAGGTRESIREGRELAAQQGEQASAEEVAVHDRAPRQLVELLVVEAECVDLP